jgi:hypothetical protein
LAFAFLLQVLLSNPDFWGPMAVVLTYSLLIIWGQLRGTDRTFGAFMRLCSV